MTRPSFTVVSLLCGVLVVAGFSAKLVQNWIVPTKQNSLADAREDFLSQAGEQNIDWRTLDASQFAEARRLNRPILVVVGSGASEIGRAFDHAIFSNQDVQGMLKRYFICLRVDTDDQPRWRQAFLPLTRLQSAFACGFGAYVLDVDGKLLHTLLPVDSGQRIDYHDFLAFLRQAEGMFDRRVDSAGGRPGSIQASDLAKLSAGRLGELPPIAAFARNLEQFGDPVGGGFPWHGYQAWLPLAWRFWLSVGEYGKLDRSLDGPLASSSVDWLGGGFFRAARTQLWSRPEYDNCAVLDAEMAWTLAASAALQGNRYRRAIAEATFDGLLSRFLKDGFVAAYIKGDEREMERSRRASFSPRELRSVFPDGADRDWVQERMCMRTSENPSMTPRPRDADVLLKEGDRWKACLATMRAARQGGITLGGLAYLDVNGTVAARLLQCARLWGDRDRMLAAEALCDRLDAFRAGDDVSHRPVADGGDKGFLGDYVAYADCQLQLYLASGRVNAFRGGLAVLRRALDRFSTPTSGEFVTDATPGEVPPLANPPFVVDDQTEATLAGLARLCFAYGNLLAPKAGAKLIGTANAISQRYGRIAAGLGPFGAGLMLVSMQLAFPELAVVIGPDSAKVADRLAAERPLRIVAPRLAEVREDLVGRPPGVYLIRLERIIGPLTADQALGQLAPTFPAP